MRVACGLALLIGVVMTAAVVLMRGYMVLQRGRRVIMVAERGTHACGNARDCLDGNRQR